MPKTKERDASEFYKKTIRELKKRVRELEQQIRQYEKYSQDEEISGHEEDTVPKEVSLPCPHCGKGNLKFFELVGRIFEECTVCDHRRKIQ